MLVDLMTFPQPLRAMSGFAKDAEAAGYHGLLFTESGRTAYLSAAVSAIAAPSLELSTGVAVAFPRSPMVTAQVAWELQEVTRGHFRLGLGTQVKKHVTRRYATPFEPPGPRMRDYVLAVKAAFAAFRGVPLNHRGPFYELTFMSRQWSPGPIAAPDPKIDIAAVNPWMLRMAGEVADGVHIHPIGHPGYLRDTALPAITEGAAAAGRKLEAVSLIVPVMTIVGDDEAERAADRSHVRAMLSFYGSTPNYAFIWDEAGFEGTTARIRQHQAANDPAGMAAQITDAHLAVFTVESTWDGLVDALIDRYGGLASRLVLYNAATAHATDPERFRRYGEIARLIAERTA